MTFQPDYWAEIEAAWDDRAAVRPAPVRSRRAGGVLLAAAMLGLAEAIEPRKQEEVVVEVDADLPEEPVDGLTLHFDPGSPRRTIAVVHRP